MCRMCGQTEVAATVAAVKQEQEEEKSTVEGHNVSTYVGIEMHDRTCLIYIKKRIYISTSFPSAALGCAIAIASETVQACMHACICAIGCAPHSWSTTSRQMNIHTLTRTTPTIESRSIRQSGTEAKKKRKWSAGERAQTRKLRRNPTIVHYNTYGYATNHKQYERECSAGPFVSASITLSRSLVSIILSIEIVVVCAAFPPLAV